MRGVEGWKRYGGKRRGGEEERTVNDREVGRYRENDVGERSREGGSKRVGERERERERELFAEREG